MILAVKELLLAAALLGTPPESRITASVDPRVELVSLVCRLAGFAEYNRPQADSAYSRALDRDFGQFRDHAVVKRAQALRIFRGISYDAPMSLAVHLVDVETLAESVPFDRPPVALEERWTTKDARAFVEDLRDFVQVTGFLEFVAEQQELYAASAARLQEAVARRAFLDWFDRFFGKKEGASFRVVAGLLVGPNNFGVRVVLADGREVLSPVLGVGSWDPQGLPVFGEGFEQLLAHEFCHSYTNPVVKRHMDSLSEVGEKLMARDPQVMKDQAYGDVQSMLNETFVRACVGRYVLEAGGEESLRQYVEHNHGRGFVWTEGLVTELAAFETDRERYPDIDAFVPRIVEFLNAFAGTTETTGAPPK